MSANTSENGKILPRPPIVAVMGHVDHGKTSLLDYIRKANVASKEAGGITQSIGAYEIAHAGKKITFIDTPGHEAFTKMRTRGARIADLAILVVAADEGVKPQTQESIRILEETKTSFIVAITKIDRNNADIEKVKSDLTSNGVLLEGFGGSVSYHGVSAKTGEGVDELLDLILLAAELEGISYDPNAQAKGFVLEARMDRRRGNEATVIVKNGTLKFGYQIVTPSAQGKVKILEDFTGKAAKELIPSAPALIIGFEGLPQVGEEFVADKELELSKDLAPTGLTKRAAQTGNNWGSDTQDEKVLRLILKAADQGSLEALSGIMHAMAETQPIRILQEGVGDLGDNDVQFAISAQAIVLAFKSRIDKAAKTLGDANKVKILASEIIYDLVREVELAVKQMIEPTSLGELTILAVFNSLKSDKQVVGGKVTRGVFKDRSRFSIMRGGTKVAQGRVTNLQKNKEEAHEVLEGSECGIMATSPELIQVGDILVIEPEV